jgi:hypothetical protein
VIDLKDIDYVKGLQSDARAVLETGSGKNLMEFLEVLCGWFQSPLVPGDRMMTDVAVGRREVIATLKTLLTFSAEDICNIARNKEGE